MKRYLLYGPNGAGKSSIGEELSKLGYKVIEADDISARENRKTNQKVVESPPFTEDFLQNHRWNWNENKLLELIEDESARIIIVVGGAHNMGGFMHMFDKKFLIFADFDTRIKRLRKREPDRWLADSPEVKLLKDSVSNYSLGMRHEMPQDTILISNTASLSQAVERVTSEIDEQ